MSPVTRKIRIQIPPANPQAVADVIDAATGEHLAARSFDLHADSDGNVILKLELLEAEASIVGTWECRRVKEEPNE